LDVWNGRTEKPKKYWDKNLALLMATVEQEGCEQREPLRLVS
jgi:hypothetical protein